MRVVNRSTFLAMPDGTIYRKLLMKGQDLPYGDYGKLSIKRESVGTVDWWSTELAGIDIGASEHDWCFDAMERTERSMVMEGRAGVPMSTDWDRDGLYDADQLFLVLEVDDLLKLRELIDEAISVCHTVS